MKTGIRGECDSLFFYQLLLPICDPKKSGITDDSRKGFFADIPPMINLYACKFGMDGTYGEVFRPVTLQEVVNFEGIVHRHGVRGGGAGIHLRWDPSASDFDELVYKTMSYTRFLQIKRTYKLCNNYTAPKPKDVGYNPAYKFDKVYNTQIFNINWLSEKACDDLCSDESTYGFGGYGEAGTGLISLIVGKPGISKGGQIVLLSDVDRLRPRAYLHRHKIHEKPVGWNKQGPCEVRAIMSQVAAKVQTKNDDAPGSLWEFPSHSTWDNFFSGDQMQEWMGEQGYGQLTTTRRDCLPKGVPEKYLAKKKTDTKMRSKVARFNNPVTMVKTTDEYQRMHVTFQSTSSCNISGVNSLRANSLYVRERHRGQGEFKRLWGIKMNHARELYLKTYGIIDTLDKYIANANIGYRSWKYWHSAMNHGKAMALAVAYDIYKECAEGNLNLAWKVEKPVAYKRFHDILSRQLLEWSPVNQVYAGDKRMRRVSKLNRMQRQMKRQRSHFVERYEDAVSLDDFKKCKSGIVPRLCGNLIDFKRHIHGVVKQGTGGRRKGALVCQVCGKNTYSSCSLCEKTPALCFFPAKGCGIMQTCFLHYHNDMFFGLTRMDSRSYMGRSVSSWTPPSAAKEDVHAKCICQIVEKHNEENS